MGLAGLKVVRQAEVMIIERLGKYNRTLASGINIIWPIVDKVRDIQWSFVKTTPQGKSVTIRRTVGRIDLRETVYDFPEQSVITKDNVVIMINGLLYYQVTDPMRAVYEVANLPNAIEKLAQTTLRNIVGELDLDETLTSRDEINGKMRLVLDEATDKWGVKVNRVELQNINPPPEVQEAMEKQMKAERERRSMILEAEGVKQSKILRAEGERDARIAEAEGERRSKILRAEGDSEAISLVSKALEEKSDPAAYLIAMRYLNAFETLTGDQSQKSVFIPYEASGVLSSLGTIKELLTKAS